MKREQKYFERDICYDWQESEKQFYALLNAGWQIIMAIPIQYGKSHYTYTGEIHYVLEREIKDEKEN